MRRLLCTNDPRDPGRFCRPKGERISRFRQPGLPFPSGQSLHSQRAELGLGSWESKKRYIGRYHILLYVRRGARASSARRGILLYQRHAFDSAVIFGTCALPCWTG